MDKEKKVDLLNKMIATQGDIQRAIIWLTRMDKDIDEFKKELFKDDTQGSKG